MEWELSPHWIARLLSFLPRKYKVLSLPLKTIRLKIRARRSFKIHYLLRSLKSIASSVALNENSSIESCMTEAFPTIFCSSNKAFTSMADKTVQPLATMKKVSLGPLHLHHLISKSSLKNYRRSKKKQFWSGFQMAQCRSISLTAAFWSIIWQMLNKTFRLRQRSSNTSALHLFIVSPKTMMQAY